jgi:hypothetical protein
MAINERHATHIRAVVRNIAADVIDIAISRPPADQPELVEFPGRDALVLRQAGAGRHEQGDKNENADQGRSI